MNSERLDKSWACQWFKHPKNAAFPTELGKIGKLANVGFPVMPRFFFSTSGIVDLNPANSANSANPAHKLEVLR